MTGVERFERAMQVFQQVCDLPDGERCAFLTESCGGDAELRAEVESLLQHDETESAMIEAAEAGEGVRALVASVADESPAALPKKIGHYRILHEVGRGGMGVVYEAEQNNPQRRVALKVIRRDLTSGQVVERFQREAHVLGRLQHPGIAQVYEAGFAQAGNGKQPFFAMELVDGCSLGEFVDQRHLCARARMELIARTCDAVHYAHEKGIIHRDLKPTNILVVTGENGSTSEPLVASQHCGTSPPCGAHAPCTGQPKVLDFGVARITDADVKMVTLQTEVGQLVGTLSYMSPEQVTGRPGELDRRSDIYALGVILHELLAGKPPHNIRECTIPEAARIIHDEEPSRLGSINSIYRGDIETIVGKALEKDPTRRYQTAAEMAADIRHFLLDQPIQARPAGSVYQLRKFARRNKGLVAGVVIAFIALTIGVIGFSWKAASEATARRWAEHAAYQANLSAAAAAIREQDVQTAEQHLARAPEARRGWEWRHLHSKIDQSMHVVSLRNSVEKGVRAQIGVQAQLGFHEVEGGVRFWWNSYGRLTMLAGESVVPSAEATWSSEGVKTASLTQDGRSVLILGEDATARWVDSGTGALLESIPVSEQFPNRVRFLNFPRNASLASVQRVLPPAGPLKSWLFLCFSPDAARVALIHRHSGSVWDLATAQKLCELSPHPEGVGGMAFSPDGRRLVTAGRDRRIRLFDLDRAGALVWETPRGHTDAALTIAFSPDGELIASGGEDRVVRLWAAETGEPRGVLIGHRKSIMSIAFSPDGRRIVSADYESVRVWDVSATGDLRVLWPGRPRQVRKLAISPDGTLLASGYGELCLWDVRTGRLVAVIPGVTRVGDLSFDSTGKHLAVSLQHVNQGNAVQGGAVVIIDVRTGQSKEVVKITDGQLGALAFAPKGGPLATFVNSELVLWDAATYEPLARLPKRAGPIAYGPRGRLLATSKRRLGGASVSVWDTGASRLHLEGQDQLLEWQDQPVFALAFSPDGRLLAVGGSELAVFDVASGRRLATLRGHTDEVRSVAFLPDGTRLASGSNDRTIRLWDLDTFEEVTQLRGHLDKIADLVFTPDGGTLFSCSPDYTVRMWDTRPLNVMLEARDEYESISARLTPHIRELFQQLGSASAVVEQVEADATLTPREHEIANQLILRASIARMEPAP